MKKSLTVFTAIALCLSLIACGSKKETAASIARQWCDLNGKAYKAEGPAKEAAEAAREKFEQQMQEKYKSNEVFLKEIEQETEKCEDASEGR